MEKTVDSGFGLPSPMKTVSNNQSKTNHFTFLHILGVHSCVKEENEGFQDPPVQA